VDDDDDVYTLSSEDIPGTAPGIAASSTQISSGRLNSFEPRLMACVGRRFRLGSVRLLARQRLPLSPDLPTVHVYFDLMTFCCLQLCLSRRLRPMLDLPGLFLLSLDRLQQVFVYLLVFFILKLVAANLASLPLVARLEFQTLTAGERAVAAEFIVFHAGRWQCVCGEKNITVLKNLLQHCGKKNCQKRRKRQ